MYKKCKVVMLPTDEKAVIGYLTAKGKEFNDLRHFTIPCPKILDSIMRCGTVLKKTDC